MDSILKQAQKLQEDMEKAQKKLEQSETEVRYGGGAITLKITGSSKISSITLSEEFLKENKQTIETSLLEAFNEAIEKSREGHEEIMKEITSALEMPLPGLDELGGKGAAPKRRATESTKNNPSSGNTPTGFLKA